MTSEILLRKTIRSILESQGASTVRVDPGGSYRPFGIVSGVALDTGMSVLQNLDPTVASVWAGAGCAPDNNWPFKTTTPALETGNAANYADDLMVDVRDNAVGVIAACAQLAASIASGGTLASTTTFKPASSYTFNVPATVSSKGFTSPNGVFDANVTTNGAKFLSAIYSRLSSTPTTCDFDSYTGSLANFDRAQLVAKIKLIAQAAFQGGQSQLDRHVSLFQEPGLANVFKTIKVNRQDVNPSTYIINYKKLFVSDSQRLIALIK